MRPTNNMKAYSTYGKQLRKSLAELEERLEKSEEYAVYLAAQLDKSIAYSEHIADALNKLMEQE